MIIYGTRATPLKSLQLTNEVCANCNTKGSIVLSVFSKYVHIFWIPTFPIGRTGVSTCTNCQQTLVKKDMSMLLKLDYEQAVAQTRVPVWTWTGLGLIALLIIGGISSNNLDKANYIRYVNAPAVGDIYQYMAAEKSYTLLKVISVSADSVTVQFNDYETDSKFDAYKLKEKPFGDFAASFSKADIVSMYNAGTIYAVER